MNIKIDFEINDPSIIQDLHDIALQFPGDCNLVLHILNNQGQPHKIKPDNILVSNDVLCINAFRDKIGLKNVWLS